MRVFGLLTGGAAVASILFVFLRSIHAFRPALVAQAPTVEGATAPLGKILFTQYLLPFEVLSILLLVAMVGVILLSKKDLK